ncbi:MAG: O-methyltransferase [Anaerolineales bacterium]|nr:MAG: O-methyltransferase [Anaerolineales bacterium]
MEPEVLDVIARLEMRDQQERSLGLVGSDRIQAVHPDSGRLLYVLALAKESKSIVEVGTSHGYSTLWLAAAAKVNGGRVVTCDINPERIAAARQNFADAGLADVIEILEGDARETLRGRSEPVDLLFIDSEKSYYETFFDAVYQRLVKGGMVVADNAVSHQDELEDYISYVENHPNLESARVPIGRGLEISVKLTA